MNNLFYANLFFITATVVMFMTVSRVSFFVLILVLGIVLVFQKRKIVLLTIPLIIIFTISIISFTPALIERLGSTINEVDVLVDASTGRPIGHAKEVTSEYFKDKIIVNDYIIKSATAGAELGVREGNELLSSSSATSSSQAVNYSLTVPYYNLPEKTKEEIDVDGWFHTGDIGQFVDKIYLKITDRKKEIFKTSGGKYIVPQAMENKFKESRFIEQIMVVGENQKFPSAFIVPNLLERLLAEIIKIKCNKPVYVKMPINIPWEQFDSLLKVIDKYGLQGVIIGNLNKNYDLLDFRNEAPQNYAGGISGKTCRQLSTELIRKTKKAYGSRFTIIGVGGVMSEETAMEKFEAGADLIMLITGLIYEGPSLVKKLCKSIARRN